MDRLSEDLRRVARALARACRAFGRALRAFAQTLGDATHVLGWMLFLAKRPPPRRPYRTSAQQKAWANRYAPGGSMHVSSGLWQHVPPKAQWATVGVRMVQRSDAIPFPRRGVPRSDAWSGYS